MFDGSVDCHEVPLFAAVGAADGGPASRNGGVVVPVEGAGWMAPAFASFIGIRETAQGEYGRR